jgi:hypothetical protein
LSTQWRSAGLGSAQSSTVCAFELVNFASQLRSGKNLKSLVKNLLGAETAITAVCFPPTVAISERVCRLGPVEEACRQQP